MYSIKNQGKMACLMIFALLMSYNLAAQNNIALNKKASQSSNYTSNSGQPSKAIDGNTDGRWGSGSVTHTKGGDGENNPWWSVDLGKVYEITQIRLWNRTDCCSNRLNNFKVLVKNTAQESWRGFVSGTQRNTGSNPMSFNGKAEGRYVLIQLMNPKGILSLAEVEVYGLASPESVDAASSTSNEYLPAIKGDKVGCGGNTFHDPIDGGTCWSCPEGYKRTVQPVTSIQACEKPGGEKLVAANRHGRGGGMLGVDCPNGEFWDPIDGHCYSCPKGYNRTAHPVNSDKACSQRVIADYQHAYREGEAKTCGNGYFFDIGTDRCWSCPKGYERTVFSVDGEKACKKKAASN